MKSSPTDASAADHSPARLSQQFGERWNRFWFDPLDPIHVAVLRSLVGCLAVYYLVTFTPDLVYWFGDGGVLSRETVAHLTGADQGWGFRASFLNLTTSPTVLWVFHGLSILVAILFTVGLLSRVMNVLTLLVVLSYIHRGPILTGPFEPILCFLLLYLCLAPTGRRLSFDGRFGWSRGASDAPSVSARVATRLIQVHLVAMYGLIVTNQLAGEAWWNGEAVWWLAARSESRLADLTGLLAPSLFLINALTHAIVLIEIGFIVLVWPRLTRPYALAASCLLWLLIGVTSGLVSFAAAMLVGNAAFLSTATLRRLAARGD